MSNVLVTVTAFGQTALQDLLGIEAAAKPGTWISQSLSFGVAASFEIPGSVWTRLRPQLNALANTRVPAMNSSGVALGTGKTQPALIYSMEWVPGDRPRIHRTSTSTVQLSVGTPSDVTVYGSNLLGGYAASSTLQTLSGAYNYALPGTRSFTRAVDALKITANVKGPLGNKIAYSIEKESGGGSVAVTMGADGEVYIKVTPAASASNSTDIAAQISGSTAASEFITATALVASSRISPTTSPQLPGVTPGGLTASSSGQITKVYLTGGDGGGVAILDVCSTAGVVTNRLRLTAVTGGNDRNQITMTLTLGTSNAISVVDSYNIVVSRAASTVSIATLVGVINGHAPARALVVASAIGTDSNLIAAFSKTWLYGGGGETPVATLAGAATSIISQSDTQMVLHTTAGALAAVSATAGQMADLQIQMNYGLVTSGLGALAA